MIIIETQRGLRHFTKAVFVWTGHVSSGWPTAFHTYIYNDPLNGIITFGHDDDEPAVFTWFIPNGQVQLGTATIESSSHALREFKQLYGDRLIVWVNHKEGMPMVSDWSQSEFVVRCIDLKFPAFEGSTQSDFRDWATPLLEQISSDSHYTVPLLV